MSSTQTRSSWRWLAALAALAGLVVIVGLAARGEASFLRVYPAAVLFVGGSALLARMSARPRDWARAMNGPEARRFFALSVAVSTLLGLAGIVITLGFLSTFRR
jgi:hypothetical protein